MTPIRRQKILWILDELSKNAKNSVEEFEGKPFTSRSVIISIRQQCAMIQVLANIIKELMTDD